MDIRLRLFSFALVFVALMAGAHGADCADAQSVWLVHGQPYSYDQNTIEVVESNIQGTACTFTVDGVPYTVDENSQKTINEFSIKVLSAIAVHSPGDTSISDFNCTLRLANQVTVYFTPDAPYAFGPDTITLIGVDESNLKCGIEVNGIVKWVELQDEEYFGNLLIKPISANSYSMVTSHSNVNDQCNLQFIPCECDGTCVACTDTDQGNNVYTRGKTTAYFGHVTKMTQEDVCRVVTSGSVSGGSYSAQDVNSCVGSNCYLMEYYVEDKDTCTGRGDMTTCVSGCSNGACNNPTSCTDSDNGENYYLAGEAKGSNGMGTIDNCDFSTSSKGVLNEAICENGVAIHKKVTCPSSKPYCNMAICSSVAPICKDTDGGVDTNSQGTITEPRYKDGPTHTDYCQNMQTKQPWNNCVGAGCGVREYYCQNPYSMTTYQDIACPNGCNNGICKADQKGTCSDTDVTNDPSIKGKVSIERAGYEGNGVHYDYCDGNSVTQRDCILTNGMYYLQNTGFFSCPNGCSDGKCLPVSDECTDSDGGKDYYVKGTAIGIQGGGTDYCQSDGSLEEFWCDPVNKWTGTDKYRCPSGCSDGACIRDAKSDLVITKASAAYYANNLVLKFTVKNIGKGPAVSEMTKQYKLVGIWGKLNGNDLGWTEIKTDADGILLKPDEEKTIEWKVYGNLASDGKNKISLFVDRTYNDAGVQYLPNGYIEESNEVNNEYLLYFTPTNECQASSDCEAYFSSCSCSWICKKTSSIDNTACARACTSKQYDAQKPSCECKSGLCDLTFEACGDSVCYGAEFSSCDMDCGMAKKFPLEIDTVWYQPAKAGPASDYLSVTLQNNGNAVIDLSEHGIAYYPSNGVSSGYQFMFKRLDGEGTLAPGERKTIKVHGSINAPLHSESRACDSDLKIGLAEVEDDQSVGKFISISNVMLDCEEPTGLSEPTRGKDNAPVEIIEYGDFLCPFSKRFHDSAFEELLDEFIDDGSVRFTYRNFPLDFRPQGKPAALAAECANEQGKFWEFHDILFEHQDTINEDNMIGWAAEIGLDLPKFEECIRNKRYQDEVEDDISDGKEEGIDGTPTFLINGRILIGSQPYSEFKKMIEEELGSMPCQDNDEMCGGIAGLQCCSGLSCKMEGNYPDASGICVKKDTDCKPICQSIGTKSEGWYDSCTGKFIRWDRCGSNDCLGCYSGNRCLEYGTRLAKTENLDAPAYCDTTSEFIKQKGDGADCQNNYECISNSCAGGKCTDLGKEMQETRNLIRNFFDWLKRWF